MARPLIHPLLAAALEVLPKTYTLRTPLHLGGPQPVVPRSAQSEIVLWCADTVLPYVSSTQRGRYGHLLLEAQSADTLTLEARRALGRSLDELASVTAQTSALRLAGLVSTIVQRDRLTPRNAVRTARAAVARAVGVLQMFDVAPDAFLEALDARLLRTELVTFAKRRCRDINERLETIVHRAGDAKGDTVVWAFRLRPRAEAPGATWGALVRNVGFHWIEGTRADALAIIPDEHLEAATAAAFADDALGS